VAALEAAATAGAATACVVSVPESELEVVVEHPIVVVVGPEFLAGSTRLKAGTAQKLVLNMLSTISMIRLGKTFGNLMVDVVATNEKLRGRRPTRSMPLWPQPAARRESRSSPSSPGSEPTKPGRDSRRPGRASGRR
jgi:N-acetylmuramic acid 6-phosphate (MurNAc-6-P) etherase